MRPKNTNNSPYSAAFTGCSFMLYEMNRLLPLLMAPNSDDLLRHEQEANEVLMVNAVKSRSRYITELKRRFAAMPRWFWEDYKNFSEDAQRLAMLLVLMQTYRLVLDLQLQVTVPKWRSLDQTVKRDDLAFVLYEIAANDEFVDSWSDETKDRVMSAFITFLSQSGLLDRKTGALHRSTLTEQEYAWYVRHGYDWFLEACLLQPYEIENIRQLAALES